LSVAEVTPAGVGFGGLAWFFTMQERLVAAKAAPECNVKTAGIAIEERFMNARLFSESFSIGTSAMET